MLEAVESHLGEMLALFVFHFKMVKIDAALFSSVCKELMEACCDVFQFNTKAL